MFDASNVFPVNIAIMTKILANANSDFKFSYKQFLQSINLPASTSVPAIWSSIYKGFQLYMDGDLSAEDAAKHMQKSVEREQVILKRKQN